MTDDKRAGMQAAAQIVRRLADKARGGRNTVVATHLDLAAREIEKAAAPGVPIIAIPIPECP